MRRVLRLLRDGLPLALLRRPRRTPLDLGFGTWLALAGLLALTAAVILYLGRSTTFYFDEWNFVLERRAWGLDALLEPHNEHLSLVPVLIYKALFSTLGIDAYAPYRVAGVVVHLIVLVLLFVYARRRVGDVLARIDAAPVPMWTGNGPRWAALIALSAAAFLTLPRMFQVMVVESVDEGHLAVAGWAFPLYLFLMSIPMSIVAICIGYAGRLLYPSYAAAPRIWGITPMQDQMLGSLIMWIPGGLFFFVIIV